MTNVEDVLATAGGDRHEPFPWKNVGDTCKGVISDNPVSRDIKSKFSGDVVPTIILAVTDEGGDTWAVFLQAKSFILQAVKEALDAAGVKGLELGARIAIKYTEDRDTGKGRPARVFTAQYQPPAAAPVGVADLL